jgi:hypothetical protein
MVRAALAFVLGAVVWMAAFLLLTIGVAFVWPAYRVHGRTWFESGIFTFEPPMAVLNVVCWVLAAVLAGWLTGAVARRPEPVWALAVVLEGYLAVLHLILEWSTFPWWYNLAVVLTAAPAVLLGGKLAGRLARPASIATAL